MKHNLLFGKKEHPKAIKDIQKFLLEGAWYLMSVLGELSTKYNSRYTTISMRIIKISIF